MVKLVTAFLQLFFANAPEDVPVPLPVDVIAGAISVVSSSDPSRRNMDLEEAEPYPPAGSELHVFCVYLEQ
jgi:hypothetical protein